MSNLLQSLTQDAVSLAESELPSPEQVRTVLGSLIKHVEAFEAKVLPADVAAPVEQLQTQVADAVTAAVDPQAAAGAPAASPSSSAPAPAAAPEPAAPVATPVEQVSAERDSQVEELLTRLKALL